MTTLTGDQLPTQNPRGGPEPQPPSQRPQAPSDVPVTPEPAASAEKTVGLRDFSLLIALLLIGGFFAIRTGGSFLGARNLSMLAIEMSITAVLALGMLLILLPGHIDLSAGSSVALFGAIGAVLVFNGLHLGIHFGQLINFEIVSTPPWPAPLAMLAAFAAGLVTYWLMGLLIIKQAIPAFIISLGGLLVFRGLQWKVINNSTVPVSVGGQQNLYSLLTTSYVPPVWSWAIAAVVVALMGLGAWTGYRHRRSQPGVPVDGELDFLHWVVAAQLIVLFVLVCNRYRGLPLPTLILGATAFVVYVFTRQTAWGRYLYAIGGNEEAAFVSGVPVHRVAIGAFVAMGAIAALTGFLQTAYAGASTTTVGTLMELDAVAACVIGGTSLKGGRGTVAGVLFGALIMAVLLNGMTLMAVSPEMKYIARGSVLALAVWMDVRLSGK